MISLLGWSSSGSSLTRRTVSGLSCFSALGRRSLTYSQPQRSGSTTRNARRTGALLARPESRAYACGAAAVRHPTATVAFAGGVGSGARRLLLREGSLQRKALLHLLVGSLLVVAHAFERRDADPRVARRIGEERAERLFLVSCEWLLRIHGDDDGDPG